MLFLCVASRAVAAPREVALTFTVEAGLDSCPDERWIRQAVSARLGFDPFKEASDTKVDAVIVRAERGLKGTLQVNDPARERPARRELASVAGDCLELASAMELAIVIAVDPQYLTRSSAPAEKPAALPPPSSVATPVLPAPVATSMPPKLHVGVGALGSAGISPFLAAGVAVDARVKWKHVSVGIEGRAQFHAPAPADGGRVGSSAFLGAVVSCAHYRWLAGCGVVSAGALQVTGEFSGTVHRESSPLLLAGVRLEAWVPIMGDFGVRPFADVQAVLTRTTVQSGSTPVWVTAPVMGTLGLMVDFRFL